MEEPHLHHEEAGANVALYVILTVLLLLLVGAVLWFMLGQPARLAPERREAPIVVVPPERPAPAPQPAPSAPPAAPAPAPGGSSTGP